MTPHQPVPKYQRANAKRMRKSMTEAELKLWNALRAHRLEGLGFRRQMPIGNFIVDFACAEHRLIVEVDGIQHAEDQTQRDDARRTRYLEHQGWRVIRFWNHEVLEDIDGCCQHILATLGKTGASFQ